MMQTADWANAAYEAARRRDRESVLAVIDEVIRGGPAAVEDVSRRWVDRTLTVMVRCTDLTGPDKVRLKIDVEADDDACDARPVRDAPADVKWVGGVFAAHITGDDAGWDRLWRRVPDDPQAVADLLRVLVGTMVLTALAYTEDRDLIMNFCCDFHRVQNLTDPMVEADRASVAHLN